MLLTQNRIKRLKDLFQIQVPLHDFEEKILGFSRRLWLSGIMIRGAIQKGKAAIGILALFSLPLSYTPPPIHSKSSVEPCPLYKSITALRMLDGKRMCQ